MAKVQQKYKTQRDKKTGRTVQVCDPKTGKPIPTWRWGVRYIDRRGRRKRDVLTYRGKSRKKAQEEADLLEAREREYAKGLRALPTPATVASRRDIKEVIQEHLKWGRFEGGRGGYPWSPTHAHDRQSYLGWWVEELGPTVLGDLDGIRPRVEQAIQKLVATGRTHASRPGKTRSKPLTRKTAKEVVGHLKAFCAWCVEPTRGYLNQNPLEGVHKRKQKIAPEVLRRKSTPEELKKLMLAAPLWLRMLILVAICSGLRRKELRALTPGHLDPTKSTLRIDAVDDKGRKLRYQWFPTVLFQPLVDFAASGEAKRLYAHHRKHRQDPKLPIPDEPLLFVPTHAARSLDLVAEKVGIPKVTEQGKLDFHSLRTSFINLLIALGIGPKTIQLMARHETIGMTFDNYGRFEDELAQEAAERLGELFADIPMNPQNLAQSVANQPEGVDQ